MKKNMRGGTTRLPFKVGDIVLVHYEKKVGKGIYKLGRITKVHPDSHGIVRTVSVGMRGKDSDKPLPYVPRPLREIKLGVQRVAVICPIEEQITDSESDKNRGVSLS